MISNSQIRSKARCALGHNLFKGDWLYPLLLLIIVSVITGALSVTYIGSFIFYGILMVATSSYFIKRVRGSISSDNLGAAVDGVKDDIIGSLVTGLLYNIFLALWTVLFFIPGIVKGCSYALTFYIRADNPSLSARDAITESRRMMNGYKMKYFMLQLSFIGWIILGSLCFGIGILWVTPYMEMSKAVFYEEVKASHALLNEGTVEA